MGVNYTLSLRQGHVAGKVAYSWGSNKIGTLSHTNTQPDSSLIYTTVTPLTSVKSFLAYTSVGSGSLSFQRRVGVLVTQRPWPFTGIWAPNSLRLL